MNYFKVCGRDPNGKVVGHADDVFPFAKEGADEAYGHAVSRLTELSSFAGKLRIVVWRLLPSHPQCNVIGEAP